MVEAEKWSNVGRVVEVKQNGFADGTEKRRSEVTPWVLLKLAGRMVMPFAEMRKPGAKLAGRPLENAQ